MIFEDRREAGRLLARRLVRFRSEDPVVLALPRGGVTVAFEVARALEAPLDLVIARKLGAPGQPELAIGAIVNGEKPELVLNEDLVAMLAVPDAYIREAVAREVREIERRRALYLGASARASATGKTALVIDDGIATGATMRAALRAVRRQRPRRLVLAVPVAARDTLDSLRPEVDECVCLATPEPFGAVGSFYEDFDQVGDDEVRELLARAGAERRGPPPDPGRVNP